MGLANLVVPAKAGTAGLIGATQPPAIPAFAGMTDEGGAL